MAELQRPEIFKWRHFTPEVILCAVRWYLRYSLSYRDVQELLVERGLEIDHTTVWRWVQRYAPELEEDRKSTRLNSSHLGISYAVFCLKKKRRQEAAAARRDAALARPRDP